LIREDFSEKLPNANVGDKIAVPADSQAFSRIVAQARMIERELNEPFTRHRAESGDLVANNLNKF
jgi:hypothetical protein